MWVHSRKGEPSLIISTVGEDIAAPEVIRGGLMSRTLARLDAVLDELGLVTVADLVDCLYLLSNGSFGFVDFVACVPHDSVRPTAGGSESHVAIVLSPVTSASSGTPDSLPSVAAICGRYRASPRHFQ